MGRELISSLFKGDVDMKCHISYLNAHSHVHKAEYGEALAEITNGLELCQSASRVDVFTVQQLTAKVRLLVNDGNTAELEKCLEDISYIIETDKALFKGRIAGWFFYDRSRFFRRKICEHEQNEDSKLEIEQAHGNAVKSMKLAIDNFMEDKSDDRPHTVGISKLELASLMLQCFGTEGEYKSLDPKAEDINFSWNLFEQIENSEIPMDRSLKFHFCKVKCCFFFRKRNRQRFREMMRKLQKMAKKADRKRWGDAVERLNSLSWS